MPDPISATTDTGLVAGPKTTPASTAAGKPAKGDAAAPVVKTDDAVEATSGTYKVAAGRTVIGDDGKSYGPGQEVSLNEADAERCIALGFILDEDGATVVRADGPAVNVEDGVQIATG